MYVVTPDDLRTMRIPLLQGRFFEDADRGRDLAVIDESLARKFFGNASPIGRRIGGSEIIGVAGHVQNYALDGSGPVHIAYYLRLSEVAKSAPFWAYNLFLVARGRLATPALGEALRKRRARSRSAAGPCRRCVPTRTWSPHRSARAG